MFLEGHKIFRVRVIVDLDVTQPEDEKKKYIREFAGEILNNALEQVKDIDLKDFDILSVGRVREAYQGPE